MSNLTVLQKDRTPTPNRTLVGGIDPFASAYQTAEQSAWCEERDRSPAGCGMKRRRPDPPVPIHQCRFGTTNCFGRAVGVDQQLGVVSGAMLKHVKTAGVITCSEHCKVLAAGFATSVQVWAKAQP